MVQSKALFYQHGEFFAAIHGVLSETIQFLKYGRKTEQVKNQTIKLTNNPIYIFFNNYCFIDI